MPVTAVASRRRRKASWPAPAIEEVDPQHPDALALLAAAAEDARSQYPALFGPHREPPTNLPAPPRSAYLVAYVDGQAVGCGALHPLAPWCAEVRRVYVRSAHRRRGVARAVMAALAQRARALGYTTLRLETAAGQQAALALYEHLGWRRIAAFGPYARDAGCVCFEMAL